MERERQGRSSRRWRGARFASLLLAAAGCSDAAPTVVQRFESLAAFRAAPAQARPAPGRVVFIGLDGASWDYLDPLLERGELPNLARLAREGTRARLRSVECYFTPPAWVTMLTGRLPEHTGIYTFGRFDREAHTFANVSSADLLVPAVWDVASAAGRRVAVVNVPVTFPAWPVEGVMVSGIMTPKRRAPPLDLRVAAPRNPGVFDGGAESHAPPALTALRDDENLVLARFIDSLDDAVVAYDHVEVAVFARGRRGRPRRLLGQSAFPMGAFSPWLPVLHGEGGETRAWTKLRFELADPADPTSSRFEIAPTWFDIDDPFTYPDSLADELEARFVHYRPHEFLQGELIQGRAAEAAMHARWFLEREPWDFFAYVFGATDNVHHAAGFAPDALRVYQTLDRFLGHVLASAGPDTTIVVASDHGFGHYAKSVDLNAFLEREGWLVRRADGEVDTARSLVFHNLWHVWIDRERVDAGVLAERGVEVAAGEAPHAALARHLVQRARALRDASGEAIPIELQPLAADAVGAAPDLALQPSPGDVWVEFWNASGGDGAIVRSTPDRVEHTRDGVLVLHGAAVRSGVDLGSVDIEDVAPTLLTLLGLPVADTLDGQPLEGALRPGARSAVPDFAALLGPRSEPAPDLESLEDRLRALGYVGE